MWVAEDRVGLWSVYSSEKWESIERSGTANVEKYFEKGNISYTQGQQKSSAPKSDDIKGNEIRYLDNSFLHWTLQTLQTKDLFRDAGLTEEGGHSAPWVVTVADAETRITCPNDEGD